MGCSVYPVPMNVRSALPNNGAMIERGKIVILILDVVLMIDVSIHPTRLFLADVNKNFLSCVGFVLSGFSLSHDVYLNWSQGHDKLMVEAQQALGTDKIAISNNKNYDGVNARMFERFFSAASDFDHKTNLADLLALQAEAKVPRVAEAHGEPCNPKVFNLSLSAFLIAAGKYSYYACTNGWTANLGWLSWYPEYSKSLGEPTSDAVTITTSTGFCRKAVLSLKTGSEDIFAKEEKNPLWTEMQDVFEKAGNSKTAVHHWIRRNSEFVSLAKMPIFGRKFSSGTCVTLDFTSTVPEPCIPRADGTVTGSHVCK